MTTATPLEVILCWAAAADVRREQALEVVDRLFRERDEAAVARLVADMVASEEQHERAMGLRRQKRVGGE
jgi:hypothetical protein